MPKRDLIAGLLFSLSAAWSLPLDAAEAATLRMTRSDCARMLAQGSEAAIAYRPGIDVRGRNVARADLAGAGAIEVPPDIVATLELDLVERFGGPQSADDLRADAPVGEIELREGRAFFNGQPLDAVTETNLRAQCREALKDGG